MQYQENSEDEKITDSADEKIKQAYEKIKQTNKKIKQIDLVTNNLSDETTYDKGIKQAFLKLLGLKNSNTTKLNKELRKLENLINTIPDDMPEFKAQAKQSFENFKLKSFNIKPKAKTQIDENLFLQKIANYYLANQANDYKAKTEILDEFKLYDVSPTLIKKLQLYNESKKSEALDNNDPLMESLFSNDTATIDVTEVQGFNSKLDNFLNNSAFTNQELLNDKNKAQQWALAQTIGKIKNNQDAINENEQHNQAAPIASILDPTDLISIKKKIVENQQAILKQKQIQNNSNPKKVGIGTKILAYLEVGIKGVLGLPLVLTGMYKPRPTLIHPEYYNAQDKIKTLEKQNNELFTKDNNQTGDFIQNLNDIETHISNKKKLYISDIQTVSEAIVKYSDTGLINNKSLLPSIENLTLSFIGHADVKVQALAHNTKQCIKNILDAIPEGKKNHIIKDKSRELNEYAAFQKQSQQTVTQMQIPTKSIENFEIVK